MFAIWRTRIAAALTVTATLSLSACTFLFEEQANDDLAITLDGGSFSVVVCEDVSPRSIWMYERPQGAKSAAFWTLESSIDVAGGDEIFRAVDRSGLRPSSTGKPALDPGTIVLIQLVDDELSGRTVEAAFAVPDYGMPEGEWLHPDGSVTPSACPE